MRVKLIAALLAALASPLASLNAEQPQRKLLQNRGSDSMAIAVVAWAEEYQKINPALGAIVSGGGTGTGIAALLNGTVDFANASRPMSRGELSSARERGIAPVQHIVGYDAVAIYLHRDNPLRSLSFSQIAVIFGRSGATVARTHLGVEVHGCKDQKIVRVGRQNGSGTYVWKIHLVQSVIAASPTQLPGLRSPA
jgi:phosphate transport system substrate-binding protein